MSTKKPLAAATPEPESKCPACGYCPHCGRRDAAPTYIPYPVYPYYPTNPWYVWPYWSGTINVAGGANTFTYVPPAGNAAPQMSWTVQMNAGANTLIS